MAAAVERYPMPGEFLHDNANPLTPAILPAGNHSLSPRAEHDAILPKAASYTYFPILKDNLLDEPPVTPADDSLSVESLISGSVHNDHVSSSSSGTTTPDSEPSTPLEMRRKPSLEKPEAAVLRNGLPKLSTPSTVPACSYESRSPVKKPSTSGSDQLTELTTPPATSLSSRFRRRSWMPSSRSPSPKKPANAGCTAGRPPTSGKVFHVGRRNSLRQSLSIEIGGEKKKQRSRSTSLSRRLSNRLRGRTANTIQDIKSTSGTPAVPVLPKAVRLSKSFSTDKLPLSTLSRPVPAVERLPQVPRPRSHERNRPPGRAEPTRKRDELWTVFRTLDAEYQKFQAKPSALKTNVVRLSLIPFLRSYQSHPSVHKLRPEDLDRRAVILNKWWSALLELLHGINNQSISGTDRPALMEGILGIMERPEWRLDPSPFCSLNERIHSADNRSSTSSASPSSQSSDFVMESVHHNVRNIFTQNILGQMCFVVEKMSLRNAPASLVSFCGKTCAYAFFFVPGIADVLVRLWNPTMDLLNRILVESELSRAANLTDTSKAVGSGFPAHLSSLQYTTLAGTYRSLRKPAPLPLGTHHLPWSGMWVNRWTGKDSDLFYVFVKYFHLLATEFLPANASRKERLCAPGLIFVHAQILINMDFTIHRHASSIDDSRHGAANMTFDDVLSDPDSSAPVLPLTPMSNATRSMNENRLIMLVRDFLSERGSNPAVARSSFAQAFADLLKAAARRTSIYDHNACYILCDFVEEAFLILVRYEQVCPSQNSFLDWPFWLDAWQQMVQSHNTTTEIRLYALLYSLWTPITIDPTRKSDLCSSFLLEPEFFQSRFNHWCPMVRAYYMRLLCWRLGRYDGEDLGGETYVFQRLLEHLQRTYSHYLYLRQHAHENHLQPPTTSPCNPAPGRRLLIIRTDPIFSQSRASMLSFENLTSQHANNVKRNSTLNEVAIMDARPASGGSNSTSDSDPEPDDKSVSKKWALLRTIIGTSKLEHRGDFRSTFRSIGDTKLKSAPRSNDDVPPSMVNSQGSGPQRGLTNGNLQHHQPKHRAFSFKFSLEWVDRLERRLQVPGPMRITPPRLPLPAQQLLQASRPVSLAFRSPDQVSVNSSGIVGAYGIDPSGNEGKGVEVRSVQPTGAAASSAKYSGRALAEWALVVGECQSFFDRRRAEGVPGNRWVETPSLGVEAFKRPG